jgi:hypothetical protein
VSADLLFLCVSPDLRFSETSATAALPLPWSGSSGPSLLFFSPDDELLGFFLLEKPKLKHQHIATQMQVSDRYALKICGQWIGWKVWLLFRMWRPKIGIAGEANIPAQRDARCYLRKRKTNQ